MDIKDERILDKLVHQDFFFAETEFSRPRMRLSQEERQRSLTFKVWSRRESSSL